MDAENQDMARVQKAIDSLSEFFDTVHIFCTRFEPESDHGTINVNMGDGNWFARYGQIRTWLVRTDETTRIECRKDD